jgi:hypothetical protein
MRHTVQAVRWVHAVSWLHALSGVALGLALCLVVGLGGCSGWLARSEGLDPATLPEGIRPDYAVFAQRCSKCHSLARPLSSGIDDDDYWAMYVARMRRQPASGISKEDTVVILRFLHYFSEQKKAKKDKHTTVVPTSSPTAVAPSPLVSPLVSPPVVAPLPVPASSATSASPASPGAGDGG